MRRPLPRQKFEDVLNAIRAKTEPADTIDAALYNIMQKGPSPNERVAYAYDLYQDTQHRAVLDAFLLADAPLEATSRVLGIPENVLKLYAYFFFDVSAFRNRLERISYASNFAGDAYSAELLKTGVMVGADYLIWTYGGRENVETRQVVRHTMMDAFFRGMSHKGNTLTSGVTKEAQKWWATAIKNAEILEKMDPQAAKQAYEELRIALEGTDGTLSVEKAPCLIEDILH